MEGHVRVMVGEEVRWVPFQPMARKVPGGMVQRDLGVGRGDVVWLWEVLRPRPGGWVRGFVRGVAFGAGVVFGSALSRKVRGRGNGVT